MKSNITTYNSNPNQKKSGSLFRFKSDRLLFFICILIAAVFWLLIKLSATYTVDNSFQLSYKSEPAGLRVTKVIDSSLHLNLTARGFLILKMNLFNDMDNLAINLDNYTIESNDNSRYSIYTQELTDKLADIIGVGKQNIQFSKAKLSFEMEKSGEKLVKVIPNYSLSYISQYDMYKKVTCEPEYINVYGPQNILDTLNNIYTNNLIRENVMSNFVSKVKLINPSPDLLRLSITDISLNFKVEKFTESEITVPINHKNLNYNIVTFPSQAKVFYQIAQIDFNKIQSNQFDVFPVTKNIDIKEVNKLPLKLSKQPNFVRNVRIVPSSVEFLIIK